MFRSFRRNPSQAWESALTVQSGLPIRPRCTCMVCCLIVTVASAGSCAPCRKTRRITAPPMRLWC